MDTNLINNIYKVKNKVNYDLEKKITIKIEDLRSKEN
jgi:hypothetical protein